MGGVAGALTEAGYEVFGSEEVIYEPMKSYLSKCGVTVFPSFDGSRLIETAQVLGCATGVLGQRQGSMGIASGDFDHNNYLDLHVTNFWNQPPDLYLQQNTGLFVNGSTKFGLYEPGRQTVACAPRLPILTATDGWI